jgi:DNA polymerase
MREPRATIDFETRSTVSLKKVGTWRYSVDPTTEILCLCYRLPYWEEGRVEVWTPEFYQTGTGPSSFWGFNELMEWVESGGLLEAHNAWFERCIWQNILVPSYGFPRVDGVKGQWRCSAAKAAAAALPRSLADAINALGLSVVKSDSGKKVMQKMTKPRKVRKKELASGIEPAAILYHESQELTDQLLAYCKQDVLAEEALSHVLPDLSPDEQQIFDLDAAINERGFQLDQEAVLCALRLLGSETKSLNRELENLTEGAVKKASERAKLQAWFQTQGLELEDTTKETVNSLLDIRPGVDAPPSATVRPLEILQAVGQSSTAKYESAKLNADPSDWRVRGGLLYHGARTGRWSGKGVQPHNFLRGTIKDIDRHWAALTTGVQTDCEEAGGTRMSALAQGLRGIIIAGPNQSLYVADYNAIEARVLPWLADDTELLNDFRQGTDPYLKMASTIYGYPCNRLDHGQERALGKVAILGLGYQMGASKFRDSAWTMGKVHIDDDLAQRTVDLYREYRWKIKHLWWAMQDAAMEAVNGPSVTVGKVRWSRSGRFLHVTLPSGRNLSYPDPEVRLRETPWGEKRPSMTFMGVDTRTHKWSRQTTYGGLLVENVTQAVARDIMAYAMLRLERGGIYKPVLSVHDEVISEADPGIDIEDYVSELTTLPAWANGCPIAAEGWTGGRYRK